MLFTNVPYVHKLIYRERKQCTWNRFIFIGSISNFDKQKIEALFKLFFSTAFFNFLSHFQFFVLTEENKATNVAIIYFHMQHL